MPDLLIRFAVFTGRVLLLCAPQACLSLLAIGLYTRAGIFPSSGIALHAIAVLTGQLIFFGGWAFAAQRVDGERSRRFRSAYATALLAKGVALNLIYAASYFSFHLWSNYLSWQNIAALLPHFEGFHAALGPAFILAVAALGLLVALAAAGLLLLAPRLLQWLRWTYADPLAMRFNVMLATLTGLVAAFLAYTTVNAELLRERDPIYAFWGNAAGRETVLTPAMLADRADGTRYAVPENVRRRNVVVIIVDCLRADHLSFHGYHRDTTPFLASLARAGHFQGVEFAVSNGNDSPQGIRAVLSARYPHHHNIYNFKLHDVLKRAGYRTHVIATGDHTTLGDMRRHYGPNLDVFADGLTSSAHSVNDDRGLLEALQKIPPADGQPAFFFFHLMSAHSLGVREPEYQRWNPSLLKMDWGSMVSGNYSPEVMNNTYDNGLYQADHFLRRIFEDLRAKGYLGDYLGVLTGDHGEGLGERGNYGHTRFLYMEDIRVPILFFESTPVDYGTMPFGSHVDIAPTLLQRLGLPPPQRWDGRSLFHSPPPRVTFASGSRRNNWQAVVLREPDGRLWKYLVDTTRRDDPREYLFNLGLDPGERTNLLANGVAPPLAEEMRRLAAGQFSRPNNTPSTRAAAP